MTRRRSPRTRSARRSARRSGRPARKEKQAVAPLSVDEIESLRTELERSAARAATPRWNADPEDVRRSVAKLVLTLVDFIRQLLERQALRRMDAGTLSSDEIERMGQALMKLEETVHEIARTFDLAPEELNLDLGPIGKLI